MTTRVPQVKMHIVGEFTKRYWLLVLSVIGLGTGLVAWAAGNDTVADGAWAATTVLTLVPVTIDIARQLIQRRAGVDVIALLAMGGALALGEYLTGAVIALMVATGIALARLAPEEEP